MKHCTKHRGNTATIAMDSHLEDTGHRSHAAVNGSGISGILGGAGD